MRLSTILRAMTLEILASAFFVSLSILPVYSNIHALPTVHCGIPGTARAAGASHLAAGSVYLTSGKSVMSRVLQFLLFEVDPTGISTYSGPPVNTRAEWSSQ